MTTAEEILEKHDIGFGILREKIIEVMEHHARVQINKDRETIKEKLETTMDHPFEAISLIDAIPVKLY